MPIRRRSALLWVGLSLLAGMLLLEGVLRVLIFHGDALPKGFLWRLRLARSYADYQSDDDFWKLIYLAERKQPPPPPNLFHPELGWISPRFSRKDLRHEGERSLGGRRPVLLYGDSFAHCVTPPEECFDGLLERSDLARDLALFNYGVQGYGLDQILLLLRGTLPLYRDRNPLVVVSFLLDDNLDRSWLRMRGWPKPRLVVRDGALVREGGEVPPIDRFLEEHPITIRSYAAAHLVEGTNLLPRRLRAWLRDEERIVAGKRELNRRILEEILSEIERHGCEAFFVVFEGEHYLAGRWPEGWRHALVLDFLRERGVDWVRAGRQLLDRAAWEGRRVESFFGNPGHPTLAEHLTAEGNAVAFRALREGIEGRFEPREPAPLDPGEFMHVRGAPARLERGSPAFAGHLDVARLRLPAGAELRYDLDVACRGLEGRLRAAAGAEGPVRLLATIDDRAPAEVVIGHGGEAPLRLELDGAQTLRLAAEGGEVVLCLPRFR